MDASSWSKVFLQEVSLDLSPLLGGLDAGVRGAVSVAGSAIREETAYKPQGSLQQGEGLPVAKTSILGRWELGHIGIK